MLTVTREAKTAFDPTKAPAPVISHSADQLSQSLLAGGIVLMAFVHTRL
jgi:hypothetical protein